MLNRYGTHPNFQLIVFTLDETVFSTEIGPLAGFYPSVYAGAPWWFIDAPEAIRRYRSRDHRVRRLRQDLGLHRRHPRVLLHSGSTRHVPATRRRVRRPAGRRGPSRRGRGGRHPARSRRRQSAEGVQAMTNPRLSRSLPGTPEAPPVRIVHLGLGNFHRAHQAWYTARARTHAEWGIAAFTGRRADAAEALAPAGRSLHLDHPQVDGDDFEVIGSRRGRAPVDRPPGLPRLPRSPRGRHGHHHGHRGRLPPRAGRAPRRRRRALRRRGADRGRDRAGGVAARPSWPPDCSPAGAAAPVRSPSCRATTCRRTAPSPQRSSGTWPSSSIRTCSAGSRTTSTSPRPWWTGSLPSPPTPTGTP